MEPNLKTHAIVKESIGTMVTELNNFADSNVDVRYTQTHTSGGKWYAIVFYYPLEDKPIPEKPTDKLICEECKVKITEKVHDFSTRKYGKPLCMKCQKLQS